MYLTDIGFPWNRFNGISAQGICGGVQGMYIQSNVLDAFERIRADLANVLDLLMPGDGPRLLSLADAEPATWVLLEPAVVRWMTALTIAESMLDTDLGTLSEVPNGLLAVEARHLLDDYWWLEAYPATRRGDKTLRVDTGSTPAMAVLRVPGSRERLPCSRATYSRLT